MARGPRATGVETKRRQEEAIQARYDAAGTGRRIAGWNPPSSGPRVAGEGVERIRNRARDAQRNDWAGESSVQKWTTTLVGVGITPRWKDKRFEDDWAESIDQIDADGLCDAYGMQALGVRSLVGDGEVFLRNRPRRFDLPFASPMQAQLIESDFVPMLTTDAWAGLPRDHKIVQGVEFDRYGQRAAYWLYKEHPGDKPITPSHNDLVRVAARYISHIFEPTRPGQVRGVSDLAPILVRLRASMDFEDAVLDRQKLANLFVMFITRAIPDFSRLELDPKTGLPVCFDSKGRPIAALEPGISQELDPGQDVKFANPPEAGTTFSEYMRTTHMGTAAGQGLPYELFSGDIKDISDRTLRVIINEFRRYAEQRQWHTIIPKICRPMVAWWAEAKYLRGDYTLAQYQAARRAEWAPHGWEYIHPVQDVQGKVLAINNGLDSRVNVIGKRGDSARKVSEDRKMDETLGLTPPPAPATAKQPAPTPAPTKAEHGLTFEAFGQALVAARAGEDADGRIKRLEAEVARLSAAAPASPIVNVNATIQMPEGKPPVVNVSPTPVEVHNHVPEQPAPVVQNVVNVEPAPVDVTVHMPERETTTAITHDDEGRIAAVTQTERTVQ